MTALHQPLTRQRQESPRGERFGLRRIVGVSNSLMVHFAGKRWNPLFAVVEHRGRRSGREFATPVAARRVDGGFVISLAFGARVDWYRNLVAAGGGAVRWRGDLHPVAMPGPVDIETGLAAFNPVQTFFLRVCGIDGYIWVADREPNAE